MRSSLFPVSLRFVFPFLALVSVSAADPPAGKTETMTGTAAITFRGTSTLHDFEGHVSTRPFTLNVTKGGTWSAEADVAVADMSTDNRKRDNTMREWLDAAASPAIHGQVSRAAVPTAPEAVVPLALRIRGNEQVVPVRVTGWRLENGNLTFHGAAQLSLKQYGLKPPSVLGMIRVGDTVTLEADVTARPVARKQVAGLAQ